MRVRAVKVTPSMMTMGPQSITPCLWVFFKNTAQAIRASAESSWLAEPNSGQMLA